MHMVAKSKASLIEEEEDEETVSSSVKSLFLQPIFLFSVSFSDPTQEVLAFSVSGCSRILEVR